MIQQFEIITLQSEVGSLQSVSNTSEAEVKVYDTLRIADNFRENVLSAQASFDQTLAEVRHNLTEIAILARTFAANASTLPASSSQVEALTAIVEKQKRQIQINADSIDSFMNIVAGIFTAFTILLALYQINIHDANLKKNRIENSRHKEFHHLEKEGNLAPILILPPMYALANLMSQTFPESYFAGGLTDLAECMQAVAIW